MDLLGRCGSLVGLPVCNGFESDTQYHLEYSSGKTIRGHVYFTHDRSFDALYQFLWQCTRCLLQILWRERKERILSGAPEVSSCQRNDTTDYLSGIIFDPGSDYRPIHFAQTDHSGSFMFPVSTCCILGGIQEDEPVSLLERLDGKAEKGNI